MAIDDAGMAGQIEEFAWDSGPLGPPSQWPTSLRLTVGIALKTRFPMLVFWGRDLVQVYNDAFVPILGARHPHALGQFARDCWPEIWDTIGPLLYDAFENGVPAWGEDMPLVLERNGYPEQTNFTFSYSRIGDDNEEGGVLCTCVETTKSVMREAEFRAMADNIADIVYTHAPDGSVEWANSRWFEYTNLPADIAMRTEGWAHIMPADDLTLVERLFQSAFAVGEPYEAEIRIKPYGAVDQAYRWHLIRAVPMRSPDGTITRWAGTATDVHDRHVAQDILRMQFEREHRASVAFQNAALPKHLPAVPGLQFSAIYEASGEDVLVGGDWYDAFRLPDGRIVVSVGDVIGNGLDAAVTMSAARQAIRGAAQVFPEPAAVLDAADRALRSEQADRIVTAFLGILDPLTLEFSYASAGHPPPILRHPDGSMSELIGGDLPLGLRNEGAPAKSRSVPLAEGALLVMYTDGLTESTRDVFDGESRLRRALTEKEIYESSSPADAIRRAVLGVATDDVAILTVSVGAHSKTMTRWSFDCEDAREATRVRRDFVRILRSTNATDEEVADAELVFGELVGNVVRHTGGQVEAALDLSADEPVLHVLDRGPGFTFHARLPNDNMSESGRGLYITTRLAREVSVVQRPDGGSHARVVLAARKRPSQDRRPIQAAAAKAR